MNDRILIASAGAAIAVLVLVESAMRPIDRKARAAVPALLSLLFAALSLRAVITEGPLGFWPEHVRNRWGNQIWLDLLLAVSSAWFLAAPEARRRGMRPWPWLVFIVATGSIGLLAFAARLTSLRARDDSPPRPRAT
jgi:hypothetical protein